MTRTLLPELTSRLQRLTGCAALALALCPTLANAAAAPVCLSRAEARAVLTYSLPQVIDGTAKRCRQALPADAFLTTHGQQVVQRYSGNRDQYWPQARSAFLKLSSQRDASMASIAGQLPDETLKPLVDATVSGLVAQSIHLESCDQIDLAIDLLSPLPPQNTAGLIALFIELAAKADAVATRENAKPAKLRGLAICKD